MKFSIITVTYNAGKSLETTLKSIREQTFKDFELILIDGRSTDETLDIINANMDIISSFISEKDKGIYDAMNKGIKLAKGEFSVFLNAGDEFYDEHVLANVAKSVENSNQYNIYLGYADYYDGKKRKTVYPDLTNLPYKFCHQSMFYRTSILKSSPYDVRYRLSGDSELLYRLLAIGNKICTLNVKIVTEAAGEGATYNNLWKSSKELYNIPYIKDHTSVIYRSYRLLKIVVYLSLRNLRIIK